MIVHCPKNNLNLRIETKPLTAGADATVYVRFLCRIYLHKNRTYSGSSASAVAVSYIQIFLGPPNIVPKIESFLKTTTFYSSSSNGPIVIAMFVVDCVP